MKLKNFLNNIEKYIIWTLFIPLIAMMFIQVVARYCFGLAWGWMEQISRIMYVYMGFAGMSLVSMRNGHIKVTFLADMLPGKYTKKILYLIGDLTMVVVSAVLFYLISKMTYQCYFQGQVFSGATFIPVWVLYISGAIGMAGVTIRTIWFTVVPGIKGLFDSGKKDSE